MNQRPKTLYVARSPISGRGLYVKDSVKKGEYISTIKGRIFHRVNKTAQDVYANPNAIGFAPHSWIDPTEPYKFINHSCNPSMGIYGKKDPYALRDLRAGAELTIDYSTIEADPHWEMSCSCGAKECRRVIRSIDFMPWKLYKKYSPYIPTLIRKAYERYANK